MFKSLSSPQKRAMPQNWSIVLKMMKFCDENLLIGKIKQENLEKKEVNLGLLDKAVEKEAWKLTTASSNMQNICFKGVQDQGSENVCWAYAISTMLRASIRSAVEKYNIKKGLEILENPSHHKMMCKELCINIFPFGNDGTDPRIVIKLLTTPSGLLDAGIYRLRSVTSIFENFEFEPQLFVNPKFETEEKETPFYSGTFEDAFATGKVL